MWIAGSTTWSDSRMCGSGYTSNDPDVEMTNLLCFKRSIRTFMFMRYVLCVNSQLSWTCAPRTETRTGGLPRPIIPSPTCMCKHFSTCGFGAGGLLQILTRTLSSPDSVSFVSFQLPPLMSSKACLMCARRSDAAGITDGVCKFDASSAKDSPHLDVRFASPHTVPDVLASALPSEDVSRNARRPPPHAPLEAPRQSHASCASAGAHPKMYDAPTSNPSLAPPLSCAVRASGHDARAPHCATPSIDRWRCVEGRASSPQHRDAICGCQSRARGHRPCQAAAAAPGDPCATPRCPRRCQPN